MLTVDTVIPDSGVAPAPAPSGPSPLLPYTRPDFPDAVDSTLLAAFRACPQKAFRTYFQHWKLRTESVHLRAGKAFASGLEDARKAFYDQRWSKEDAEAAGLTKLLEVYGDFECPADSAKSAERTAGALEYYFQAYPMDADQATPLVMPSGRHAIEFSFAEPLAVKHPVTGNPLIYTGRADMIVRFAEGIYVHDDKTASQLGASWSKQWDLRSQFTAYSWAAKYGATKLPINGVLVRGVSILKTKYDTQQAVADRSDWEIQRWYEQTCKDLERMKTAWAAGWWDWNLDHSCSDYGGCPLLRVCKSPDPESWLAMDFEQRVWDPLSREEYTPEQWAAKRAPVITP